jgi:Asp/Glu/hydantoin racemase
MNLEPKIFLIHAVDVSLKPSKESFSKLWPEASTMNILEESLAADLAKDGGMTPGMMKRFERIGEYCEHAGATGILFTCSAFGVAIENVKTKHQIPVLTPNEALFEEVLSLEGKIALLTTFEPSIAALTSELSAMARAQDKTVDLDAMLVRGALDALRSGDQTRHDQLIVEQVAKLTGYVAIVLGQFSMSSAALAAQAITSTPILTTPDCAVRKLKGLMTV